jgi:predicted ATPase/DNA-binding CsgD family transcriptional regulator
MIAHGPLIGREWELAALEQMLDSARLLTLTGAGGCGKTRLALELADRSAAGARRVECALVPLAEVQAGEQVLDAALRSLRVRERAGRTPRESLFERLATRRTLLILDNCEHVAGAVRELVAELLEAVPALRVLATSREPLGVPPETVFPLAPLGLPEADDVAAVLRSDAARFCIDRAAGADADFSLTPPVASAIARICRELDGLPLALSLAAARFAEMAPSEIADALARRGRLAQAAGESTLVQHRSLRASLDWSHRLLDLEERTLLRGLSIFSGGWDASAARAVVLPESPEAHVCGLLGGLEAKGLIVAVPAERTQRWSLLRTVGEYAAEQLSLSGEQAQVRERFLVWACGFAEEADALLLTPHGRERIDAEEPNLTAALTVAIERRPASALEIVASLTRHWILAEHLDQGRAASMAALASAGSEGAASSRAVVHCGAGLIAVLRGDYETAIANTTTGLALLGHADVETEGRCLQMSSMTLILAGADLEEGRRSARRAVELLRSCGDILGLSLALATVAHAEGLCDRFDAVHAAYDELLAMPGISEHARVRTWAEMAATWAELIVGSPRKALAHADLAIALEGDWPSMTHFIAVSHRVHALARLGRCDEAITECTDALEGACESGAAMATPALEMALALARLAAGQLAGAQALAQRLLVMPQHHTRALMHETLARIALARGDAREAKEHAGELAAVAELTGSVRQNALADYLAGRAQALAGAHDRARELLQAALAAQTSPSLERAATDTLEELALLSSPGADRARRPRLAAAAAAARTRLGYLPLSGSSARLQVARERFIARFGSPAWESAWAEGEALSLAEAIAYARRAHGPRDRPTTGLASLTPTELEVARLAATGISNPQIAARLFMSRSTVKSHLSAAYLKLGVANRTELAQTMATTASDTPERAPAGAQDGVTRAHSAISNTPSAGVR